MFTGIIKEVAPVISAARQDGSLIIEIQTPKGWALSPGDSVATNGVCLTVKQVNPASYTAELMAETLKRTSFGTTVPKRVNLELPMRLSDRLDGHLVQGHVDNTGTVLAVEAAGNPRLYTISFPARYAAQIVEKGSITVDGVSLTVVKLDGDQFTVSLVEYTLTHTTLQDKAIGDTVNLEFDMIAKYVAKLITLKK